jgi:hypothetical protein
MSRRTFPCLAVLIAITTGCSVAADPPEQVLLAQRYFDENNAAARRGPQAQQDFFTRTQHPDFAERTCELGDMTVQLDPALSTLHPDREFSPEGTGPPRGDVWVVAAEVTTRRHDVVVGRQIGSLHLVVLDGQVHGFAPCPA